MGLILILPLIATAQENGVSRRQVEYAIGYATNGTLQGLSHQFQYSHGVAKCVDLLAAVGSCSGHVAFDNVSETNRMYTATTLAIGAKLHGSLGRKVEVGLSALAGGDYCMNVGDVPRGNDLISTIDWQVAARGDVSCRLSQNLQLGVFYTLSSLKGTLHSAGLSLRFCLP